MIEAAQERAAAVERLSFSEKDRLVKLHRLTDIADRAYQEGSLTQGQYQNWGLVLVGTEQMYSIQYSPLHKSFVGGTVPLTYVETMRKLEKVETGREGLHPQERDKLDYEIGHFFSHTLTDHAPQQAAALLPWIQEAQQAAEQSLTAQELKHLPTVLETDFQRVAALRIQDWLTRKTDDHYYYKNFLDIMRGLHTLGSQLNFDLSFMQAHAQEAIDYLETLIAQESVEFDRMPDIKRRSFEEIVREIEEWGKIGRVDTSELVVRITGKEQEARHQATSLSKRSARLLKNLLGK